MTIVRIKFHLWISLILLLPIFNITGASPEVSKVVDRLRTIGGFKANVVLGPENGGERGVLSYSGGKFHLQFSDGRVLASNGRELIMYNPVNRVAGKQDLTRGSGGAGWLLYGYSTKVTGNSAELKAEDPGRYYQEVRLSWDETYMLKKLSMRPKDSDRWISISLSNVRAVESFPASLFSWKPPAGSRTVENPLNQSS